MPILPPVLATRITLTPFLNVTLYWHNSNFENMITRELASVLAYEDCYFLITGRWSNHLNSVNFKYLLSRVRGVLDFTKLTLELI